MPGAGRRGASYLALNLRPRPSWEPLRVSTARETDVLGTYARYRPPPPVEQAIPALLASMVYLRSCNPRGSPRGRASGKLRIRA